MLTPAMNTPGGNLSLFQRQTLIPIGQRLAALLTVDFLINQLNTTLSQHMIDDDDAETEGRTLSSSSPSSQPTIMFPLGFGMMTGPSMIPTIHPSGEIYLYKIIQRQHYDEEQPEENDAETNKAQLDDCNEFANVDNNTSTPTSFKFFSNWWTNISTAGVSHQQTSLKVGDVVILLDNQQNYICKRIIGLNGDPCEVLKSDSTQNSNDDASINTKSKGIVPRGFVWVEGDNPLASIDSRHYGPLPISNVRGKVIYRIWPRVRKSHAGISWYDGEMNEIDVGGYDSCFMSNKRPKPLTREELFDGPFGIFEMNER